MDGKPVTVTRTTVTTSVFPGLESSTIVGSPRALLRPLGILRLLQVLSTCVTFSMVAHVGAWGGSMGTWCMFSWCFSFVTTFLILFVELCGLQIKFSLSWMDCPITCACYSALFCLTSSIIYPTTYVRFLNDGSVRNHAISATVFSCVACAVYALEVTQTRKRPGVISGYMATKSGMIKVFESFVACLIFLFISTPYLYKHEPALEWCVVVYCVCFILTTMAILMKLGNFTNILPMPYSTFLTRIAFLSALLYTTNIILWPLYQFNKGFHGQPKRSEDSSCNYNGPHSVCGWDRRLAVTILTGINLLAYLYDYMYSG